MTSVTPDPPAAGSLGGDRVAPGLADHDVRRGAARAPGRDRLGEHPPGGPLHDRHHGAGRDAGRHAGVRRSASAPPADFDRTLHLAGVHVFATSTVDVTIVPHVCHGGSVNVTTTPESFCAELRPDRGRHDGERATRSARGAGTTRPAWSRSTGSGWSTATASSGAPRMPAPRPGQPAASLTCFQRGRTLGGVGALVGVDRQGAVEPGQRVGLPAPGLASVSAYA